MKAFAVLVALGLTGPAFGESWVELDKAAHHSTSFDKDAVENSNGHVRFWLRQQLDAPHPIGIYGGKPMKGENILGTTQFVEMRSLIDIDCATHTAANPYVKFYDATGQVVSEAQGLGGSKPIGAVAVIATVAKSTCGNGG